MLIEKMAVGKEQMTHEIVKARNDKREYKRIVLKNSLEVLLVSDPDTDKVKPAFTFLFFFSFFLFEFDYFFLNDFILGEFA